MKVSELSTLLFLMTTCLCFAEYHEKKMELSECQEMEIKYQEEKFKRIRLVNMLDSLADEFQSSRRAKHQNKEIQHLSTELNFN